MVFEGLVSFAVGTLTVSFVSPAPVKSAYPDKDNSACSRTEKKAGLNVQVQRITHLDPFSRSAKNKSVLLQRPGDDFASRLVNPRL